MVQYSNGGLKTGLKKPVYGPNVQYSKGPPSQVKYRTPILCSGESGIKMFTVIYFSLEKPSQTKIEFG